MRVLEIRSPPARTSANREGLETEGLPHLLKQSDVALTSMAEAEVGTDVDFLGAQMLMEKVANESPGRGLREPPA